MHRLLNHPVILAILIFALAMSNNSTGRLQENDLASKAHVITNDKEFDFVTWTLGAAWKKISLSSMGLPYYLSREQRKEIVTDYILTVRSIEETENALALIYSDPNITNKQKDSGPLREKLNELTQKLDELAPYAESILQEQVSAAAAEMGLTTGGQAIPPVLYHISPLPLNLVISPRATIQQEDSISLRADLTVAEQVEIESVVDSSLDRASLVVPVGGLGAYPTMVMRTSDLPWLVEVVSHEWIHNYLTLRPLGLLYESTPELRTMNETTANIAGKEIGKKVLEMYYAELLPQGQTIPELVSQKYERPDPHDLRLEPFDYRAEMHKTRVTVDALLAEGKIDEAEAYMEERRQLFWEHGYAIRKINQAYFAFYGAYADVPGGAAGQDPVGPAVRKLREESSSLAEFVNDIAWMTSFEELLSSLNR